MSEPHKVQSHDNHGQIVCQIVGRCHVSESNRTIIRYFISRLKQKERTWRGLSKSDRREWLRQIIECHSLNVGLYRFVMRGTK